MYPWKSSSLHLIIENSHRVHLLKTIIMWSSQFTKCFLYIYLWIFLDYKIFWDSNTLPPFSCLLWKRWLGGKCFASVCWSFSLFVGWPVCTVSVACSISFYPLPERYLIGIMVASGKWMIPEEFKVMCSKVNVKLLYLIPSVVSSI